jgi:hypothetical protein
MAEVQGDHSVTNITQTLAKATNWATYLAANTMSVPAQSNLSGANPVIIVAVVGTVNCDCSVGSVPLYSWKLTVIDQASGSPIAVAENAGPLPAWFTALPNAK